MFKALALSLMIGSSISGGCGEETFVPCGKVDGDGYVFDAVGICCHTSQLVVDPYRELICDLARPVLTEVPDAGMPDAGEEDAGTMDAGEVDAGTPDAGEADAGEIDAGICPVTTITACPLTQVLVHDPDRCVDRDAPDGGTECPPPPDAGNACPSLPDQLDAGFCTVIASCPFGQIYDGASNRCRDVVEACRYTCDAGKVLTEDCRCIDFPNACPICPACTTCKTCTTAGSYLNTTSQECFTPPVPPICPGPCPSGEARDNTGTCVAPVVCKTCLSSERLNTATQLCEALVVLPGPCPSGQARNNNGVCVAPILCKTCTAVGSYLNTTSQECVTPPVPPGPCSNGEARDNTGACIAIPLCPDPCPSGEARDNAGNCVAPVVCATCKTCLADERLNTATQLCEPLVVLPGPKLTIEYRVKPELLPITNASIGQADVAYGTVEIRNVSHPLPAEITEIVFAVLAADVAPGPYTVGGMGNVLVRDHVASCTLKSWPPFPVLYGPVSVGSDSRVRFSFPAGTLPIPSDGSKMFDVRCSFTQVGAFQTSDFFALDPEAPKGNAVNGSTRTALTGTIANGNGNPPLFAVPLACGYLVTSSTGTQAQVLTKPTFARSPSSPTTGVSPTWALLYAFTESASSCADVNQRWWQFRISYNDRTPTGWGNALASNAASRFVFTDEANASTTVVSSITAGPVVGDAFSLTVNLEAAKQTMVAGAPPRTFWVYANLAGAQANDTIQVSPDAVSSWYGVDNPPSYPAQILSPEFPPARGNTILIQ